MTTPYRENIERLRLEIDEWHMSVPEQERDDQFGDIIADLRSELAIAESLDMAIQEQKEKHRRRGNVVTTQNAEILRSAEYTVSGKHITWIPQDATVAVCEHVSPGGKKFWLGRITELANITSTDRSIVSDTVYKEIEETVAGHIGLKLESPGRQYHALRPMAARDKTKQHTVLNPYSDDSVVPTGFTANDLRVLVLEDTACVLNQGQEQSERITVANDTPVYLIASICRHDQDAALIYGL